MCLLDTANLEKSPTPEKKQKPNNPETVPVVSFADQPVSFANQPNSTQRAITAHKATTPTNSILRDSSFNSSISLGESSLNDSRTETEADESTIGAEEENSDFFSEQEVEKDEVEEARDEWGGIS